MYTAFAYARVSTKEQAARNNSIPEQFTRIQRYAEQHDIQVVRMYQDSESLFHDSREQFQAMIQDAIRLKPAFIMLETPLLKPNRYSVVMEEISDMRTKPTWIHAASQDCG